MKHILPLLFCASIMATGALAQDAPAAKSWAFAPPRDEFSAESLLDLRSLNEKVAGESGFVRRSADGNDFVLGDGTPARFWAVTTYVQRLEGTETLAHHARWMAKRGVNMVRFHGQISPKEGAPIDVPNPDEVDQCWKLVAAMKREGIYTTISPYWAQPIPKIPAAWNVAGEPDQGAWALLFFDPTLQEAYKSWMRVLMGQTNPYTGIALKDDPSVALIQLQNEDSMLFWTMQSVKGAQLTRLRELFGEFLVRKYGSLDKANAAWGGASPEAEAFQDRQGDDFAQGRAGLYILWEMTQAQSGYKDRRVSDQTEFFGRTMREFNAQMATWLRDELGCQQLINAGNWKTADEAKLGDVERWSYGAGDVIAVNRYFDGVHLGPRNGWAVDKGDYFTNVSALRDPRALPLNVRQSAGHPTIIGESHWVPPTLYQSEGPLLTAAYQSLTGLDAFYWFCIGDGAEWQPPLGKWNIGTPMELGQFPAAALLFRKNYVEKGAPAVREQRALTQLWQRQEPALPETSGFDPNRDAVRAVSETQGEVNPLAFLVGPVEVGYGDQATPPQVADLSKFVDANNQVVHSSTGQLSLDYGAGLFTLDTPSAQGVSGFLAKAGALRLRDVTIQSSDDYATIIAVALDEVPLPDSRRVLVQIGTTMRPTGWLDKATTFPSEDGKTTFEGQQVVEVGAAPWQIARTNARLEIANPHLQSATALDANGMPTATVPVKREGNRLSLTLPADALYVVLR